VEGRNVKKAIKMDAVGMRRRLLTAHARKYVRNRRHTARLLILNVIILGLTAWLVRTSILPKLIKTIPTLLKCRA
jgi:hypothetical protein